MGIVGSASHKLKKEGPISLAESVWRNSLRKTVAGSALRSLFDDVFVEKLVMAPRVGYWPHIREPRSFNEKITHRKLFTDDHRFAEISDKVSVKSHVSEKVGDHILPDVYHTTKDPQTISFDSLPETFVIKTGNKGVLIVDDKQGCDQDEIRAKCQRALDRGYGKHKGEYWYANTEPQIIVEERLYGLDQDIPIDYKFYVFHGHVEYVHVDIDRFGNRSMRFYDRDWTPQDFTKTGNQLAPVIEKPEHFDEMIDIAEMLGDEFEFMRVDLYQTRSNGVVFGEMTPAPASGTGGFTPTSVDFEFGSLW